MLKTQRRKRKTRIRSKMEGTADIPRLAVFRSSKYIYAQLINDTTGKTIVNVSETSKSKLKGTKIQKAEELGKQLGKKAVAKKITKAVFDRAGYKYHGRVKALAEGAKAEGLQF